MTAVRAFRTELINAGYEAEAIVSDYVFSDVFAETPQDRRVTLAAFTQTPPSYRNAALAVIDTHGVDAAKIVADYRALGAPLLFVLSGQEVIVWQVRSEGAPRAVARVQLDEVAHLFASHRQDWSPSAIHRAKSIGAIDRAYQLDFVDAGLLPMVEGQVHAKLDHLIDETLTESLHRYHLRAGNQLDERALFRTTFRLLAAKVLQDRDHSLASQWDANDIDTVLDAIARYYNLPRLANERSPLQKEVFGNAWQRLRGGINFRNISADDLAFVYENTLITPETRKHFGTHSTPRQVAEYVVDRLELWRKDPSDVKVYEPFTGAGAFLVATLRHIRDYLPSEWTDRARHEFLVARISGDEIDAFACEVATLSLILADYPNANGWKVSEHDLFIDNSLVRRAHEANVVLCNPPFESFSREERRAYPPMAARSATKGAAVLGAVLDTRPNALGFVLPRAFLDERQFQGERRRVEQLFADIDLVALPEHTFKFSTVESALLIARSPRVTTTARSTSIRSSVVTQHDRENFLRFGKVSNSRLGVLPYSEERVGDLWIRELDELWRYLAEYPTLGAIADIHRGIEWKGDQSQATSNSPRQGYRRGLHNADSVRSFVTGRPVWLDTRPNRLLYKAADLPWGRPKIIANAVRLSRGPWRLAAAVDSNRLVCSQQLFGCWLRSGSIDELAVIAAVLNGPIANAFVTTHSPANRIRVSTMKVLPLPLTLPRELAPLVAQYVEQVSSLELESVTAHNAAALLDQIDAVVLKAYDLPPRLERELLEQFRNAERPTVHPWRHWLPEGFGPAIPLHEYLSEEYTNATRNWVSDVFTTLPEAEAELLREYME
ncbi:MAG TPA: N-6 DNA methylase [Blastocatellia bacterium]